MSESADAQNELPANHIAERQSVLLWPVKVMRWLYEWVVGWADKPGGTVALGAISFTEASFFPIPPDPLMWAMSIGDRRKSLFFATVTTVTSVLGAIFGWILGMYLFTHVVIWVVDFFGASQSWFGHLDPSAEMEPTPESYFGKANLVFQENGFFALFVAALTPIPFKVATISSGFFKLPLLDVVVGSLLGRGLRFYTFGILFAKIGDKAKDFIDKYFTLISVTFVVLLFGGFWLLKYVF